MTYFQIICEWKEIPKGIRQCSELNENDNIAYQTLWDAPKARLWGRFFVVNTYIIRDEMSQINNLSLHLRN